MIRLVTLEKNFGKLEVLKGVSFEIQKGAITAIIGPNGSGKSTIIKSVLGLVKPDRGDIFVKNQKISGESSYKKAIGYMPQAAKFPENLRLNELVGMIKDLRHNPSNTDEELFQQFRLENEMDKAVRTLSGGTRQKVNAYIAFLFDPDILILDEPTAGLDPISSSFLKDKILKEKSKGKTVILTSHIMSELEELSEKVVFLLDGKICFEGSVEQLRENTGENKLERSIAHIMKGHALWTVPQKS